MKKMILAIVIVGLAGLMIFTLFNNKVKANRQAQNANQQNFTPVSVEAAHRQKLQSSFNKTGTIVANNEVTVVSQTAGKVTGVYASVGAYVRAGAPLFKVEDAVLSSKLASARTAYEVAKREWERAQKLHQEKIISDSDLENYQQTLQTTKSSLDSAQNDYNNATITAPISGVVTERAVDLGATVSSGTTVATLVDNSNYKITVNVSEQQAFKLNPGNKVTLETNVYPDVKLSGRVKSISAKSDSVHTFPVEITIDNDPEHPLKSGIFGKVIFDLDSSAAVLAVPREALVSSIKTPQIYVVENGRAVLRDIVVDSEVNTYLVVKAGLKENEQVVVNGQENLTENAVVKVINK